MNAKDKERRFSRLRQIGCLAHWMDGVPNVVPEIHHLNIGGKAGQKRRGDEFTIPICSWHHRGEPPHNWTKSEMARVHGPSLACQSKAFRERYGTDDELLAKTNDLIEQLNGIAV